VQKQEEKLFQKEKETSMTEDQKEEKQRGTNAKSALKGAFFICLEHG
jgi:hypothetical protein